MKNLKESIDNIIASLEKKKQERKDKPKTCNFLMEQKIMDLEKRIKSLENK